VAGLGGACTRTVVKRVEVTTGVPPAPPVPVRSPVPAQPPTVWVAGTVRQVTLAELTVLEPEGPTVVLKRLAENATQLFAISGRSWHQVDAVPVGALVCAEALNTGSNLLALRVFLGVSCGPSGP
jgi:hypothetical protein